MSAKSAAAAYAALDKMATDRLLSKARKAARRTNWRKYAVWADGFRKKFFSCFTKAREYWNQIKRLGSVPIIQSWKFKNVFVSSTSVAVPLVVPKQFPNYPIAVVRPASVKKPLMWSPEKLFASMSEAPAHILRALISNVPPVPTAIAAALSVILLFAVVV